MRFSLCNISLIKQSNLIFCMLSADGKPALYFYIIAPMNVKDILRLLDLKFLHTAFQLEKHNIKSCRLTFILRNIIYCSLKLSMVLYAFT
jgi:hypothetical protein